MFSRTRLMTFLVSGAAAALLALPPAPADPPADGGPVKDRADFIPRQKHIPLPGKAVGLLVTDAQPVLSAEGRFGPKDEVCFACCGASYRWIYAEAQGQFASITNLRVPVGEKPGQVKIYPALNIATPRAVARWGVTAPYALVEVEVNCGAGSPPGDSFVATGMKVVEGTEDYPLKAAKAVADLRERYAGFVKGKKSDLDAAMAEAQKKALKDRKATGPREQSDLLFLTWMPKTKTLVAHFRTTVTDGAYTVVQGGARLPPFPLPPLPPGKGIQPPPRLPPPPPPPLFRAKVGTAFGVEFGMAYEVSKDGKVASSRMLPFQPFQRELPPPPAAFGPRGRPVPLPADPVPKLPPLKLPPAGQ
jgi:hypothetical protein